jgi:hypothetical protein
MKNITRSRILVLIMLLLPFSGISQWTNHYYFPLPVINPNCTGTFNDAVFISVDTGFYCMSESCSPSVASSNLWRTVDDCSTWELASDEECWGCSAYVIKYFPPYIYYIRNYGGFIKIIYGPRGFGLANLLFASGFYQDFYANSPSDFKMIFEYGVFRHYINGNVVLTQSFTEFNLQKMFFPVDTVGLFIAKLPSASSNTLIVKYTPSTGFNVVYQTTTINMVSIEFSDDMTGYVGGSLGFIMRTDDLGETWIPLTTGVSLRLNSIDFVDDQTGYAVGDGQTIIKTENRGETWTSQFSPVSGSLSKVFFVSHDDGFILCGRLLIKTTNGGITWVAEEQFPENSLNVFPNPGSGDFVINLPDEYNQDARYLMTISDLTGNTVLRQFVRFTNGTLQVKLDHPESGMYHVILTSKDQNYHTKLVIK